MKLSNELRKYLEWYKEKYPCSSEYLCLKMWCYFPDRHQSGVEELQEELVPHIEAWLCVVHNHNFNGKYRPFEELAISETGYTPRHGTSKYAVMVAREHELRADFINYVLENR